MIRVSHLSSLLLATLLAFGQGCAANLEEGDENTSYDELLGDDQAFEHTPGDADETGGLQQLPRLDARTAPVRDSRTWAQGDPRPIPWHEKTSNGADSNADDPDSPNAAPKAPGFGR